MWKLLDIPHCSFPCEEGSCDIPPHTQFARRIWGCWLHTPWLEHALNTKDM